jgi:hypothetical protein
MAQSTRRWIFENVKSLRDTDLFPFHEILDAGVVNSVLTGWKGHATRRHPTIVTGLKGC